VIRGIHHGGGISVLDQLLLILMTIEVLSGVQVSFRGLRGRGREAVTERA